MRLDRVKVICEMARKNVTVADLAERAGISKVTITGVRCGKSCAKSTAYAIANGLGVDVAALEQTEEN